MTDNHDQRLRDEHARSHDSLHKFGLANPHVLANADIFGRAHDLMTDEQVKDLVTAGLYDREHFRARNGRDPTPQEIQDRHLAARAHGGYGVRSADDLIGHVARRLTPPQHSATSLRSGGAES